MRDGVDEFKGMEISSVGTDLVSSWLDLRGRDENL